VDTKHDGKHKHRGGGRNAKILVAVAAFLFFFGAARHICGSYP
jgi:hypothetical protein